MRYTLSLFCLLAVVLPGCDLVPFGSDGELDRLNEAKVRWASFAFSRYTIKQTRSCFCPPPYAYRVIVKDNAVDTLIYDEPPGEAWEGNADALYESALASAQTVEEAFDTIAEAHGEADELRVEYDDQYGYPTEIYIDHYANAADDEIRWTMSNLTPQD